ncbi:MAG: hypothetical protein A2W25_00915 [candidate division Zixibacteria bacterium RBG_16_53_22]|nr:MAG: hypothetical protein A2W25_00915 [candidate division Zixibacteria bacterium RBG_16_53_22]
MVGFFTVISEFGLYPIQIRETSIHRGDDVAGRLIVSTLAARTILGGFSLVVILAIALLSDKAPDVRMVIILLGLGMFVTNLFGSFAAVLMGLERFKAFGIFSGLYALGFTLLAITAMKLGFGLVGIGASQLCIGLIVTAVGTSFVWRYVMRPIGGIDLAQSFRVLLLAAPLGLTSLLTAIYYRADFILLSHFKGDIVVGYYNAAYTIVNTMLLFAATFSGTLLPRFSNLFVNDFEILGRLYRIAFKYLLFVGIGLAFGTVILAGPLMNLLFGEEYLPAAAALMILIWASALMFVNSLQGTLLVASNMKRQLVYLTGAAALVNLIVNFSLIPAIGIRGAAMAKVSCELTAGVWALILCRGHNPFRETGGHLGKALVAGLAMIAALLLASQLHVLARVAIGAVVYALGLVVFKGLDTEDFKMVGKIIGFRRDIAANKINQ